MDLLPPTCTPAGVLTHKPTAFYGMTSNPLSHLGFLMQQREDKFVPLTGHFAITS